MAPPSTELTGQTSLCMDKMKSAFLYGSTVGLAGGTLLGAFSSLRHGARGKELISIMTKNLILCSGSLGSLAATIIGIQNCFEYPQDQPKTVTLHPVESTTWTASSSMPVRTEEPTRPIDTNVSSAIAGEAN